MKIKNVILILIIGIFGYGLFVLAKPFKPIDTNIQIQKIVVIKHKRTLQLIAGDSIIKTYKISLGRNPKGNKEYEGDKKTPVGQYFINDKNPTSKYHKNLGISYPNKQDIENAKKIGKNPGGQIKIHGIKNGFGWIGKFHLLMDWTAGCIALTNKEIDELYNIVKIDTPIEILP